jgi:hypothetical protein
MTLPSGEICRGEYVTVPEGDISWGQIYATVYTDQEVESPGARRA